jgi:DNA-binding response OmpR family regulator
MKKIKILIVDDDKDFCEANKMILEQAGYEVLTAYEGKKGIELAKKETPNLVILDVMLPDINGFSVCQELKEDPLYATIPVLMLTSVGADETSYAEQIAEQHKADAYMLKPVTSEKLVDTIGAMLTAAKPAPLPVESKARILLVDDDPDFLDATKRILTANKYDVITALNGEEGISKATHDKPDLIILDVMMPGKDGYSVCYELRKIAKTRPLPIIMLTSVGQQLSRPEYAVDMAIDHLADDFIEKPVDATTLLKKIEKHLTFHK